MLKNRVISAYRVVEKFPVLVLPLLWVVFSVLLVITNAIPDRLVKGSIARGIDELTQQGDHPWIFFTPQSQLDNFTDKIMLQLSQRTSGWNDVTKYFASKTDWSELDTKALHNPLFAAFSNQGYSRYWQGYTVILKPLLVFFSLDAIRIISSVLLLVLICLAFATLKKEFNVVVAVVFCLAMTMINITVVPFSLVFSPVIYTVLISILGIRLLYGKHRILLFLIIGSVINFLDFLTFPILTLCFPLALLVMADIKHGDTYVSVLAKFIKSGFAWLLGYASTWAMKWVLSSVVTGRNIIKDAIKNIFIRTDTASSAVHYDKVEVISNNYAYLFEHYPVRLVVLVVVVLLALQVLHIRKHCLSTRLVVDNCIKATSLFILALAPVVWYVCLTNHSSIHIEFFAYKNAVVSVFAILVLLCCVSLERSNHDMIHEDE